MVCSEQKQQWELAQACLEHLMLRLKTLLVNAANTQQQPAWRRSHDYMANAESIVECSEQKQQWELAQACLEHLALCLKTLLVPGMAPTSAALALEVLHDLQGAPYVYSFGRQLLRPANCLIVLHMAACLRTLLVPGVASSSAALALEVLHDLQGAPSQM